MLGFTAGKRLSQQSVRSKSWKTTAESAEVLTLSYLMLLLVVCLILSLSCTAHTMRGNKRLLASQSIVSTSTPGPVNRKKIQKHEKLFTLGPLLQYTCLSRPSVVVKSPYVADLVPIGDLKIPVPQVLKYDIKSVTAKNKSKAEKGQIEEFIKGLGDAAVLAHAPSLDCAGCVVPGATVYCSVNKGDTTKTKVTIQLCEEIRDSDGGRSVIGYHPAIAETAAKVMLEKRMLVDKVGPYNRVEKQRTFGDSRVDFVLINDDDSIITLVEIKNVVGADYFEEEVPEERCEIGVYTRKRDNNLRHDYNLRHAIFPHGTRKPGLGVVSERAIKHVHGLTHLQGSTDAATGYTLKCMILFIINREDCDVFRACHEADMLFAQVLRRAASKGVLVAAQGISIDSSSGDVAMSNELPVVFDDSVCEGDVDEELLLRVLESACSSGSGSPTKKTI